MTAFYLRVASYSIALLLVGSLLGCSDQPPLGKVSGTVTVDGKPVPQGTIVFEMAGRRTATGKIEGGRIVEVTSYVAGDGAPVGENRVAVTSTEVVDGPSGIANPGEKEPPKTKIVVGSSLVLKRYNDPMTSQLTANIQKGENSLEFKLTSK